MRYKNRLFVSGILFLAITSLSTVKAQKVSVDSWQRLQVEFTTGELQVSETMMGGTPYSTLSIDGYLPSSEVGQPSLPTYSSLIEVPFCSGYEVTVSGTLFDTLSLSDYKVPGTLAPVQPSRSKSDTTTRAVVINQKTYSTNAFYRVELASVETVGTARDRRLARLQFSPVSYNPVSGQLIICRRATVEVRYRNADRGATLSHYERYHSPAFGIGFPVLNNLYPKSVSSATPVRYLIVAHSMFRGQLDSFVQWKRRKGFLVDVAYTDSAAVGTTTTSIQSFILSQYTNASTDKPAPTFLLLVGDHDQLPAFDGTTSNEHITDLYYTTWTDDDVIPDCYHGRFSAQSVSQLTPQIQKTLMYEQYGFANPDFLDRAVMVAGVDGGVNGDHGYTHADPAMDYAITNYINGDHGFSNVYYFKNNTSVVPAGATNVTVASSASSMSATVRNYYNQGAGFINYSAHGSPTCWGTPELNISQVNAMTNTQKFGLMIGNCCQTNKFETATCLGEALLRKGNYAGAVGYIGGSDYTYWGEDFYWAVGVRNSISATMSMAYQPANLGVYDRVMHTHGEAYPQWAITQGAIMYYGNLAVESSTSGLKHYYWEIYHLMGDPSLMPYLTQADTMSVAVPTTITLGTTSLPVTAAPYAYVALVDTLTDQLVASTFANENGNALLTLPASLGIGHYRLAASAQQYRTAFVDIELIQPEGPFPLVAAVTSSPLNAGHTVPLTLRIENLGTATAHNVVAQLTHNSPYLTLSSDVVNIDSLASGASVNLSGAVNATVANDAPDNTVVDLHLTTTWTGDTLTGNNMATLKLYAPVLSISFSQTEMNLLPGSNATLTATLHNDGHATAPAAPLTFTSPTSLFSVTPAATAPFSLAANSDTVVTLSLHADNSLPQHATIPVHYFYGSLDNSLPVYIGQGYAETFEDGNMSLPGVSNGSNHPWFVTDSAAFEGTYSMRSAAGLTNYDSSVMVITVNVLAPDSVSFYHRVSSEANYDKFFFLIDGTEKFNASGETDWTRASYPLTTGTHTLTFRYAKDVSWDRGSDCVWIDNLVLPHQTQSVTFRHDTLCMGSSYAPFGPSINTENVGSGTVQGTLNGQLTLIDYLIVAPTAFTDSVVACDSYLWNGQEYTTDSTLILTETNAYGCTDTLTLVLTLHHSVAVTVTDTVEGTSYEWNGTTITASGEYQQVLTTAEGCDSTVTLLLTLIDSNATQGIGDITATHAQLRIYPNPAHDKVTVDINPELVTPATELTLFDLIGRPVLHTPLHASHSSLDVSHLPQGVYTLRIATRQGTVTCRLIKK